MSANHEAAAEAGASERDGPSPDDERRRAANALRGMRLRTVVFDDEDEYWRFLEYVFKEFQGAGLELTNVPVPGSVRVTELLLTATRGMFAMRPVTEEDLAKARDRAKNRKRWDPASVSDYSSSRS
jgi:hypothetical protein